MYFDRTLDMVLEDLESKMGKAVDMLLSKKSKWGLKRQHVENPMDPPKKWVLKADAREAAGEFVRDVLAQFDPTSNHRYLRYLAKQVSLGLLNVPEDGPAIRDAIETMMNAGGDWPGEGDVFKYKDYRSLAGAGRDYIAGLDTFGGVEFYDKATKELESSAYASTGELYDEDHRVLRRSDPSDSSSEQVEVGSNIVVYELKSWEAAFYWGWKGKPNVWCTSAGANATSSSPWLNTVQVGGGSVKELLTGIADRFFDSYRKKHLPDTPWAGWSPRDFISDAYKLNDWDLNVPLEKIKARTFTVANAHAPYGVGYAKSYLDERGEPMYMLRKDGEPVLQFTSQMHAHEDENTDGSPLSKWGLSSATIMTKLVLDDKFHAVARASVLNRLKSSLMTAKKAYEGSPLGEHVSMLIDKLRETPDGRKVFSDGP